MLSKILRQAIARKAADVILSPESHPALKILWDVVYLEEYPVLAKEDLNKMLIDIIPKNLQSKFLEEKELDFSIWFGEVRFRVNLFVQKFGFWAVMRIIPNTVPDLQSLWLPDIVLNFTKKGSGLVLITWTVWSGKSTTMAALVEEINKNYSKHIITVEDPIEFSFKNKKSLFEQREVWNSTLSFENGLKYALRQAPDVIMVWEMRDLESFRLALRAAETGNLVFATLHTSGAARTVARIIDMFPAWEKDQIRAQLAGSLIAVVWQKLIKNSTWNARVAACEVMINTKAVSNLIRKWDIHQLDWVIETSFSEWMITMKKTLEKIKNEWSIDNLKFEEEIILLWNEI